MKDPDRTTLNKTRLLATASTTLLINSIFRMAKQPMEQGQAHFTGLAEGHHNVQAAKEFAAKAGLYGLGDDAMTATKQAVDKLLKPAVVDLLAPNQ